MLWLPRGHPLQALGKVPRFRLLNTNTCIIWSLPQFVPFLPLPITLVIHIDRVHANRMTPRLAMVRNTIPGAFLSPFTGSLLPQAC